MFSSSHVFGSYFSCKIYFWPHLCTNSRYTLHFNLQHHRVGRVSTLPTMHHGSSPWRGRRTTPSWSTRHTNLSLCLCRRVNRPGWPPSTSSRFVPRTCRMTVSCTSRRKTWNRTLISSLTRYSFKPLARTKLLLLIYHFDANWQKVVNIYDPSNLFKKIIKQCDF